MTMTSSASTSPAKKHRLWFLVAVAVLSVVGFLIVRTRPNLDRNYQAWMQAGILLLDLLLALVWFFFLSRFPWKVRLGGGLVVVIIGFEMAHLVRIDGTTDGRGLPNFVWRWKLNRQALPATPAADPAASVSIPTVGLVDVPQFYGAHRDGVFRGAKLARDWQAHPPKELWRQPVGAGWSAFAVVGSRAYTQEQRGEDETVTCYDVLTGKLVWVHADRAKFFQWQGGEGPRATPTVSRGHVFAYGGTGILSCLDATTGTKVWSRPVLEEHQLQNLEWGISASPLVYDDAVVVTGGATNGPTLLAYQRATGELLWKSGTDKASYASPALVKLAGRQVILSVNAGTITTHDPATGEILLDYRWSEDRWPKASQPVILPGDCVFVAAGYGVGALLLQVKATPEGGLSATQIWKSIRMKTQFNSVGARDGYLYGLDDGLLACLDVATGTRKWKDGRFGSGQTLLVDDLVLVQSEPGPVILAAANPDGFKEYGRLPALSSKTWNHPTLAGRYLLVRNDREAVCYELKTEE